MTLRTGQLAYHNDTDGFITMNGDGMPLGVVTTGTATTTIAPAHTSTATVRLVDISNDPCHTHGIDWLGGKPSVENRDCPYCGTANPPDALECGAGRWNGCGAALED